MTYALLDDGFYDHPNFADAPDDLVGIWAKGLAYCNRHLTDGRIPKSVAAGFVRGTRSGTRSGTVPHERDTVIQDMIAQNFWLDRGDFIEHVGYLDHNPSRRSVLGKKKAAKERKQKWKDAKDGTRSGHVPPISSVRVPGTPPNPIQSDPIDPPYPPRGETGGEDSSDGDPAAGVPGLTDHDPADDDRESESAFVARCAEAYAQGIADGGDHSWVMPDASYERAVIVQALMTHQPGLSGDDRLDWIHRAAATYRRATTDDKVGYQRGFRPSKWLEWLNTGGMKRGLRRTAASPGGPGEDIVAARTRAAQLKALGEEPKRT